MTISSESNSVSYTGNGVTTAFSFPYAFQAQGDLVVVETVIATGVQTVKALTTDYTISGSTDAQGFYPSGGTVNAVTAPANTVTWRIYRDPAATQSLDLVENDPLPAESLEAALDRLTMIVQRQAERVDRTLHQPEGDVTDLTALPAKVDRLGRVLAFDPSTGQPVMSGRTLAEIEAAPDAVVEAAAAAASAAAALVSETNAAASEAAAADSAADALALLNTVLPARRNAMVNGSLLVWPTDTTFTSVAGYTAEQVYSDTGKVTRVAGVSAKYRLRHIRSGLGNQTLTDYFATDSNDGIRYRGSKATLSFTCRLSQNNLFGDPSGVLNVSFLAGTGDNQSPTALSVIETFQVTPTNTDQRFTLTLSSALASDVTQVGWKISGTTAVGALVVDGNYYELENVQLEPGDTATEFEYLPAALIYDECARYFERKTYGGSTGDIVAVGYASSTTVLRGFLSFKPKRTIPTIPSSNADTFAALTGSGGAQTGTVIAFDEISDTGARVSLTVASGLTSGDGGEIRRDGTDTTYIDISARL